MYVFINWKRFHLNRSNRIVNKHRMKISHYLKRIKKLKFINKKNIINKNFIIKKDSNIRVYYAPFDYINPKAKIMIVGITPGLQQMLHSFKIINSGKSLKQVKDLCSFKGSMRTILVKYLDELKVNNLFKITTCESLFNKNSNYLHTTSLIKYPILDNGKNYSGYNITKKKILLDLIENNFLKELKKFRNVIIVPLGNTVSSTILYLNNKFNLNAKFILNGFPHPSGLNVRKDIQFKKNKNNMLKIINSINLKKILA
jgi:hypothetical protein